MEPMIRKMESHLISRKILWAGRLDFDKRPDLLHKIALELVHMDYQIHVYGAPVLNDYDKTKLRALFELPNVVYHGPYSTFKEIPVDQYDVFLYTSNSDSLPNVLLEAGSLGLPIVASNVGGVKEVINSETGYLVESKEDVESYIKSITEIYLDYHKALDRVANLQALIQQRHSAESFRCGIKALFSTLDFG
jgi:glycosyltransferase involved in cell wall biosynthesis